MDKYREIINQKFKNKNVKKSYISNLFSRILMSIILVLGSLIYINSSDKNLLKYKEMILTDSLPFNKVSNYLKKVFGKSTILENIPIDNTMPVFNEQLIYREASIFYDGAALQVNDNYLVPIITSGIVVFIGEKENYGNTIIIQGVDGVDIWYGNIDNSVLTMYEYVEKGSLLGETKNNELYVAFQKDGVFLNYEEYI